ncbi:TolC family protein [bacterium]|nr:TolC family protein [bacterium]
MQPLTVKIPLFLVLWLWLAGPATAEDAIILEVADTGLYLPNTAYDQDRHYLGGGGELLNRSARLLNDADSLLQALHALPPELSGSVVVEQPTADELAGLIALALQHNPELAPFRSRLAGQAARTRQAGAKQDPMLAFNLANFPLPQLDAGDVPMTQYVLGWSQKYESYGKRDLRRRISSLGEDLIQLELAQHELDIVKKVTSVYYDLASTKARLNVLDDNEQLLVLLKEFAESKYALGTAPQAQVLQAQLELTKLTERRIALSSLYDRQMETLAGLLGHAEEFAPENLRLSIDYPVPREMNMAVEDLVPVALGELPDYQRLDVLENQQLNQIELARRAYRPDYTVSASYGLRYGKRDFISVGISIPLFTHKAERQDAQLQEAYATLDQTVSNRLMLENSLATEINLALVDLTRVVELSRLYREGLVPQARLALDSAIAGYAADQVDLAMLLKAQTELLNYELELEELSVSYLAALSGLQVLTAGEFDPLPYLRDGAPADGVAPLDLVAAADAFSANLAPLETADATSPPTVPPIQEPPPIAGVEPAINTQPGFISELELPQASEPVARADDPVEPVEAATTSTDFYAPYQPPPPVGLEDKENE